MDTSDYWRSGWANQTPQQTQAALPGSMASQMDGGAYGPWNALADILGAYWNKKGQEGVLDYAESVDKELENASRPEAERVPVQPEKYGTKPMNDFISQGQHMIDPKTGGTVVTNPDWLHKNDVGIELNPMMTQGEQGNNLLQSMKDFAQMNPNLEQQRQEQAARQAALEQAKAANPDQYVGNIYVGDDKEKQKQVAIQDMATRANVPNNAYKFDNPMNQYGFTGRQRQLSFDEVKEKARDIKMKAMKEMTRKYGVNNAARAESLIDDAINRRLGQYGEATLGAMRMGIGNMIEQAGNNIGQSKNLGPILQSIGEYNIAAKKMNLPEYDVKLLQELIKSNDVKFITQNVGGSVNTVAVKTRGVFDDGSRSMTVMKTPTTMSPYQKATTAEAARHHRVGEQISLANTRETIRHHGAQETETNRHNVREEGIKAYRAANGGGSRSGGGSSRGGADFNNKAVSGRVTDMLAAGKTPTEVHDALVNAGMSEEQAGAYLTPSVIEYYHQVNGDDAPE